MLPRDPATPPAAPPRHAAPPATAAASWRTTIGGVACEHRFMGRLPYPEADALMRRLAALRRAGTIVDTLLLLEHPPVLTVGRAQGREDVLASPELLARAGIEIHDTDRGGKVTYHGPGQLVVYPIFMVGRSPVDTARFTRRLGDAMVLLASRFGLDASWDESRPGVWVKGRKIGAVGVRVEGGVSRHGFAFNLAPDLAAYELINPCGFHARDVTSVFAETGRAPSLFEAALLASWALDRAFAVH